MGSEECKRYSGDMSEEISHGAKGVHGQLRATETRRFPSSVRPLNLLTSVQV